MSANDSPTMILDHTLGQLERAELLKRSPERIEPGYAFKHALLQDTAYTSLLKNERKRLHRVIGETLEREYPNALDENAALLTRHFTEAGDDFKTLEYGMCAGDAAARVYAQAEAIEHYRVALDAAQRLNADRETIIALVTKLGRMHELRDEYTNALDTYARLIELARTRGDLHFELASLMLQATLRATPTAVFNPTIGQNILDRALALARALNDGAAQAKILWNLLLLNGFTGRHRAAVEFGEQSLALARQLNLKTQIAYTLNDIGNYGYFSDGQPDRARAALAEARTLWRDLEILPMLADNLNNSGILEYIWGDYANAKRFSDEALVVSERIGSLWGQMLARTFRGVLEGEDGDYGAALSQLEMAYDLAQRTGSAILLIAATNLALAYTSVGEIERAFAIIQIADHDIEIPLYRTPAKAALAYLCFLHGQVERAQTILRAAHPTQQVEMEFSYLPGIIAEGEIGLALGRAEAVAEYMGAVTSNLMTFGISNFVADAELYRARALIVCNRFEEARAAFARGEEFARQLPSRRVLWQIYAHWANFERTQQNFARAETLHQQARALIDSIAATLPEKYRAGFLQSGILH